MNKSCGSLLAALAVAAFPLRVAAAEEARRDLTISEAVIIALASNPLMKGADEGVKAALAGIDRTEAAQKVQLSADASFSYVNTVPSMTLRPGAPPVDLADRNTWLTELLAQKIVYSGGRQQALARQASHGARASDAQRERTRQVVAHNAERAFMLLLAAQRETEVARESLTVAEDQLKLAGDRFGAGAAARFDVLRAQVQAEEARQNLVLAETGIINANAGLLEALGLAEGNFKAVGPASLGPPRAPLEELLAQAVSARPEMAELGFQEAAAMEEVVVARAGLLPSLSVSANYQWVVPESANQFERWGLNAVLSIPLYDGGQARAYTRQAEALHAQASASRDSLRVQVESEVRQAYAQVVSADAQVPVAEKRIEQAVELLRVARVRYEGGVGTATEVADAQTSLTAARQGLVRAQVQQGLAVAALRLAAGIPLPPRPSPSIEEDRR